MSKQAPPPPDFDDPLWEPLEFQPPSESPEAQQDAIAGISARPEVTASRLGLRQRAAEDAVDAAIQAGLTAVDMLYVERDDHDVTPQSVANGSWAAEPVLQPCSTDTWLRAAIKEKQADKSHSYVMDQFLRSTGTAAARPSMSAPRRPGSSEPSKSAASTSKARDDSPRKGASPLVANLRKQPAGSEARTAEDRLREELVIRRAQEEKVRQLEAQEVEARVKLEKMQRDLKGKDYTYDHKGQVVLLNHYKPSSNLHQTGPAFAVGSLQDPPQEGQRARRVSDGVNPAAAPGRGPAAAAAAAGAAPIRAPQPKGANTPAAKKEAAQRRLQSDFKEARGSTQPNALESVAVSMGVTLRQGTAAKQGPQRPKNQVTMTRAEYAKYVERKRQQEEKRQQHVANMMAAANGMQESTSGYTSLLNSLAKPLSSTGGPGAGVSAAAAAAMAAAHEGVEEQRYGVLSEVPDVELFNDARARPSDTPQRLPTPDMNLVLTQETGWGSNNSMGAARAQSPPVAPAKPGDKQREAEVGRSLRLPRERAGLATMAPPVTHSKVAVAAQVSSPLNNPLRLRAA